MSEQEVKELDLHGEMLVRREKLAALRAKGNAFPNQFRRDALAQDLHDKYEAEDGEVLKEKAIEVAVAGRIMTRRAMGKATFITLQDMSGKIQLYVARDNLPEGVYAEDVGNWDLGDIIGVKGTLFKTKTNELTIKTTEVQLLTKALRPLPNKFHGLTDMEARYRQRYLDLISNEEARRTFIIRSKVVAGIREFFISKGFMEVETPMMHPIAGGAAAKPFITHHNALDMDLYMRIAPELYLKRLLVGGFERVFEINRCFRNEGLDTKHNPEFTTCEFYWAYHNFYDLMDLTEELFERLALKVCGTAVITYQGQEIDLRRGHWTRITYYDALEKIGGHKPEFYNDYAKVRSYLLERGEKVQEGESLAKMHSQLFDLDVEEKLIQPTFVYEYPIEISPLSRRNNETPEIVDRYELFITGREMGNAFSELNDPFDQRGRFEEQMAERAAGDDEAHCMDEDFLRALEYGMPPAAGQGIGIDRLAMLLTDSASIREVILFPLLRPEV